MRRNGRYSKDSRESRTGTDTDTDIDRKGKRICRYTLSKHIINLKRKTEGKIQNLRKVVTQR